MKDHRGGNTKESGEGLGDDQNKQCVQPMVLFADLENVKALPDGDEEERVQKEPWTH